MAETLGLADLGVTDDDLLILGRQHTLQSGLDFVDGVVNPQYISIYLARWAPGLGGGVGTDVEADDNGVGCGGQKNVGFGSRRLRRCGS